jgi:hypothetical protein
MDEFSKQVLAADDAERRRQPPEDKLSRWRRRAAEREERRQTDGAPAAEPMSTMHPDVQRKWDQWCDARIMAVLEEFSEMIGEEVGREDKKLAKRIRAIERKLRIKHKDEDGGDDV